MTETYLKQAVTTPVSEDGKGTNVSFGASAVQGWRSTQEDAHLAIPDFEANTSLFGVFDGHNGAEVAQYAAKMLPKLLRKNRNFREGQYEAALKQVFVEYDDLLLKKEVMKDLVALRQAYTKAPITRHNAPAKASGCTAVVALLKGTTVYVANIGDSRCLLSRKGKAHPLSQDHKPDDDAERQRIENAGGEVVYGRINYGVNVSRAFGDHAYKGNDKVAKDQQMVIAKPDVVVEQLNFSNDNFLVLICDGVWNSVSNDELISYVNRRLPKVKRLSKICEEVFKQILPNVMPKRGIIGKDNMTFMIVKLPEPKVIAVKVNAATDSGEKDGQKKTKGDTTSPRQMINKKD